MLPSASHVSSYQLSHRIIPHKVEKHRNAAMNRSQDQYATLQTDGWTGVNFRHLIAFMITTSKQEVRASKYVFDSILRSVWQVHTVRAVDGSSDRKTADHLKILILDVVKEVKGKWKATIVVITSDALGESRAARKRIVAEFPWFVAPDCFAHQVRILHCIMFLKSQFNLPDKSSCR